MKNLHYTAYYAALFAIMLVGLAYRVAINRKRKKIGVGDDKNMELIRLKAAHENALDNIPIFLILLALFEYNGGSVILLNGLGMTFAGARISHALGISRHSGFTPRRFYGIAISWVCIVALALLLVMLALVS